MHITKIDIADPVSHPGEGYTALVSFHADDRHVMLMARADQAGDRSAFLKDALRQLRRLPEFRRSAGGLTFAEDLPALRCA